MAENRTHELDGEWEVAVEVPMPKCFKNIHTVYAKNIANDGTVLNERVYHKVDGKWVSEPTKEINQCT